MEKQLVMSDKKVYGVTVSRYGRQNGYLDYKSLADLVGDVILNNNIYAATSYEDWELACSYENEHEEIYQYYIISEQGYLFLQENTDEIVYYNTELDLYLWAVTHFGTSWDYVLTDIKLVAIDYNAEAERVRERVGAEMRRRALIRMTAELARKERDKLYEYYIQGRIDAEELKELLDSLK